MPPRISLVVDDESSIRAYVKAILEREQFQIIEAEDGTQGLHWVEKLGDALDLIVSDIQMRGGDGLTFVCSVRESFPAVPIILVSGFAEPGKYPSTSFEFVQKPFRTAALLTAIENATKKMELRK